MIKNLQAQLLKPAILAGLIPLALVGVMLAGIWGPAGAAQQGTVVTISLPAEAYAGEPFQVKLIALNAQNLAGYQGDLRYDTARLDLSGVRAGEGLAAGGRDVMPFEPVEREGALALGAATCPVANCSGNDYDTAPRSSQGASGLIELATLEFIPSEPGRYDLTLENLHLVDPQGQQLGAAVQNGSITVVTR